MKFICFIHTSNLLKSLFRIASFLVMTVGILCCEFDPAWEDPYEEDRWEYYNTSGGLSSDEILSLKIDSKGNLWVGTWFDGLMKYDGQHWSFWGMEDGLPDFSVFAIEENSEGDILLGTWAGLTLFDGSEFRQIPIWEEEIPVYSILRAANGHIWTGTFGEGLYELSGETVLNRYWVLIEPDFNEVRDITQDQEQVIWAGTRAGVIKVAGGRAQYLTQSDGLLPGNVRSVMADSWGDVWFGIWAADDLVRYDRQTYSFKRVSLYNVYPDTDVNDMLEDNHGNIWFALERGGAVIYNGSVMKTILDVDGLPGNTINCMAMDRDGHIWFGSEDHGLARYLPGNSH
jgi:ligand-binding sensor domain-containing protein